MKLDRILPFLCMYHLAPVLGAGFAVPNGGGPLVAARALNVGAGLLNKLEGLANDPKLKALKTTAQEAAAAIEHQGAKALEEAHQFLDSVKDKLAGDDNDISELDDEDRVDKHTLIDDDGSFAGFENIMKACAPRDCKKRYFLKEAMRWIKQALADIGVFIEENPLATAAFLIGVSVFMANLITSGGIIPVALEAIGFGAKGPIKNTIAAAIQSKIGAVQAGTIFSQLQAAAMGGAEMREIHKMATIAFTGLLTAGAWKLVDAGRQPLGQSADFEPKEWRTWEAESRTNFSLKEASQVARFWGSPTAEGCIAYGYREYRAPIWYVPEGMDPLMACVRTPAVVEGLGFKTPLGCLDEGPKKGVVGMWYIQTNGADCMPRWSKVEDEGCMLYGRRRKFARLLGLGHRDDWTGVCESTPALIDGEDYDGPSYCEDKGILGIYGVFDVADQRCECSCIRA